MSELEIRDYCGAILRPVVNEKSYNLLGRNEYTFTVAPHANKTEIKIAIEKILDARAIAVSTQNRQGGRRHTHFDIDKRVDVKCVIMTVAEGDRIDISADRGK